MNARRSVFARLGVCLLGLVGGRAICAQNPAPAQSIEQVRTAQAIRVERPPKLDGTLEDPIWQLAEPIAGFRQREPFEGQSATESTEVRILYTHNDIYFGIACHDSTPHGVIASQLRRDVSQEFDDYFEIVIDSRRDRRNAYVFQINPLGTQRDGLLSDQPQQFFDTQDGDPGWDGVWTSEAHTTDDGWTATVAIPFSTLNFMRSQDVVWGLNFKRFIRRKTKRIFGAAGNGHLESARSAKRANYKALPTSGVADYSS